MTSSARQTGGGNFKIEALMAYRAEEKMCLPVLRSNNLLTCDLSFRTFSHFISSHRIHVQLLEVAHCIPLSPRSVSSRLISTDLISCLLSFIHLISSHSISCLLSVSHLFSADHRPELFSPRLISSQLVSAFLRFSQLSAAHVSSCYVFSSLL